MIEYVLEHRLRPWKKVGSWGQPAASILNFRSSRFGMLVVILVFDVLLAFSQRPRLIVTTDIGQDPDDEQSMVRLLHYANEFEIEGLIANADDNSKSEPPVIKDSIIHKMIAAYAQIEAQLKQHDLKYPDADYLHSIVKRGCQGNGVQVPVEEYVGMGKDTEGSQWIIQAVDKGDDRPLNISVWGGAGDLAQALWKVNSTRSKAQQQEFIKKIRVFFIGKQDSSNDWIMQTFPEMWLILALDKGGDKWESGYRGMFWGGDMLNTSRLWLHQHIIGQNPLASLYPDHAFTGGSDRNPFMALKEGDSPSFLYFLYNGLNNPDHTSWGGWGGRYEVDHNQVYRDANDTYFDQQSGKAISSPRATVFRWRPDFQDDFAARVQWGKLGAQEMNHFPDLDVNGHRGENALALRCNAGESIILDAGNSSDPDGDELSYQWIFYSEPGTFRGVVSIDHGNSSEAEVHIPTQAQGTVIHVILIVKDHHTMPLTSYKRVILNVSQ